MYWLTADAYREFNYQEFNKLKDTNRVFAILAHNKMFPTLNLVAYAFLKRHLDFLEYAKAVSKSSIISAYALALTYRPSMPLDITKVMDIDNDAMSDILFSITQVEIPLARISEVIDILYEKYPTEVIQVISEEYMESTMFKYILQHLVANNDDDRPDQLLDRMVEID
jgi:F0F1-type ATP synthase gamma subunit